MGHDHNYGHHNHDHSDVKNIKAAFFLNLVFTVIEIFGGLFTNSIAILSDALHDLGDSLSLGLAWYFQKLSKKEKTANFTYGYKRFSLLGAIMNAVILATGSTFIVIETVKRLQDPEPPDAAGMILLAIVGVVFNGAAVLRLKKGTSVNEKVVSLHLMEDVLGWVAVLIGGIIMYFFDVPIIDPILSLLISAYILYNAVINLKVTMNILLQGIPDSADMQKITTFFEESADVKSFHDLHVWSMDGEYNILTVHLVKSDAAAADVELKSKLRHELHHFGIEHATIELEKEGEHCAVDC